jgi:hypothetical protein
MGLPRQIGAYLGVGAKILKGVEFCITVGRHALGARLASQPRRGWVM